MREMEAHVEGGRAILLGLGWERSLLFKPSRSWASLTQWPSHYAQDSLNYILILKKVQSSASFFTLSSLFCLSACGWQHVGKCFILPVTPMPSVFCAQNSVLGGVASALQAGCVPGAQDGHPIVHITYYTEISIRRKSRGWQTERTVSWELAGGKGPKSWKQVVVIVSSTPKASPAFFCQANTHCSWLTLFAPGSHLLLKSRKEVKGIKFYWTS